MLVGSGAVVGNMTDWARSDQPSEIAGVYTVSGDSRPDFSDSQLTQAAFGQLTKAGSAAVGMRYEDGSLQKGSYQPVTGTQHPTINVRRASRTAPSSFSAPQA